MLIEFRVENFRSFAASQCLSMVASTDKELRDSNTRDPAGSAPRLRLLSSAAIYGPNASGKSNLVRAVEFLHRFLSSSIDTRAPGSDTGATPFRLDEQALMGPSRFEVSFIHAKVRCQYTLAVDREMVREESLYVYPKNRRQLWFARENHPGGKKKSDWWFGASLRGARDQLSKLTRTDVPFLAVAARFEHDQLRGIWDWFYWRLRPLLRFSPTDWFTTAEAMRKPHVKQHLIDFLRDADLGVVDWRIEDPPHKPDLLRAEDFVGSRVSLAHRGARGKPVWFDWKDESDGTQQLYNLIGPWLDALEHGFVVFVDELDASLHPALTRKLLSLFHDPRKNRHGAQLVFTGHDTTLLDPTQLRRDQIWLTEKDQAGRSRLVPLSDYSPRKGEALQKGYLAGRYGAVPVLGKFGI